MYNLTLTPRSPGEIQNAQKVLADCQPAETALTDAQKATLKAYLTADPDSFGFAGKEAQEAADVLNFGAVIANPVPQGRVPLVDMAQADFVGLLSSLLIPVMGLPDTNPAKAQILGAYQLQIPLVTVLPRISFTSAAVTAMFAMLEGAGVVTADQVTTLTTQPDPAWQAEVFKPAPVGNLFPGPLLYIEAADVTAALGS